MLADEQADILHGLIVRTPLADDRHLFADRDQIAGLYERGVVLSVPTGELHEPGEDAVAADATDTSTTDRVRQGLRRAWQWLSEPR